MFDAVSKTAFHAIARSTSLRTLASRYGMRHADSFARRFIAGESVDEAIAAGRLLGRAHLHVTLDFLGEGVTSTAGADEATRAYVAIIERIAASDIERNISIKLTQLGLTVDRATCIDNLRRLLDAAQAAGFFVRIDMESSEYTGETLETYETLWNIGYRNAGVVIQSYLLRSEDDVHRLNALGVRVRLVKGAYREPRHVAFQQKHEVDANYVRLMKLLLREGTYPAIATHDERMIRATIDFAGANHVANDAFEFQMLYGIRRDLQASLAAEGYRMRVYVPFGTEWFAYFMRRLGERPANLSFVLRSVLKERR